MPVAFSKETYSSKLVLKDVVSGSLKVTEPLLALHTLLRLRSAVLGFPHGTIFL
jgi:hypothetical protein